MAFPATTRAGVIITVQDVFRLAEFYTQVLDFSLSASFDDPAYVILEKNTCVSP